MNKMRLWLNVGCGKYLENPCKLLGSPVDQYAI